MRRRVELRVLFPSHVSSAEWQKVRVNEKKPRQAGLFRTAETVDQAAFFDFGVEVLTALTVALVAAVTLASAISATCLAALVMLS